MFDKISTTAALNRIADGIEEHNRLQRLMLGVADPKEGSEVASADVSWATDFDSWTAEQEDERRNRDF